MNKEQKITDEQLKQEIENGKTMRQIAHEYGFGYPSSSLSHRVEEVGYAKNKVAKIRSDGGVNIYLPPKTVEQSLENNGNSKVLKDGDEAFAYQVLRVTGDGCIVLKPEDGVWRNLEQQDGKGGGE